MKAIEKSGEVGDEIRMGMKASQKVICENVD